MPSIDRPDTHCPKVKEPGRIRIGLEHLLTHLTRQAECGSAAPAKPPMNRCRR